MASVGCAKWPERWNALYDGAMERFEKYGCRLTDLSYYDLLQEKYGFLAEFADDYKAAAAEIAKDENFSRFLSFMSEIVCDRGNIKADIKELSMPKTEDGSRSIKHDMLPALLMCATADYTYGLLSARKLPKEHIDYGMRCHNGMIRTFKARNNGLPGAMSWSWYQLAIDARLYGIGRLQMEFFAKWSGKGTVFENENGEIIALANDVRLHRDGLVLGSRNCKDEEGAWDALIEESDDAWIGYPFCESGRVKKEKTVLKKSEWKKILEPGDPVVSVHIPPGGGLSDELVNESFEKTKAFLAEYFPDFNYKAFVCGSWLMDPQLVTMMGEQSNIAKFCKRFRPCCMKSGGMGVFNFVYLIYDVSTVVFEELPENTSLERKLKKHYLDGNAIYEMYGYIPRSRL